MMKDERAIIDTREAINAVGEILAAFLKSGPQHPNHLEDTYAAISKSAHSMIPSTQAVAASYEQACKVFLDKVKQVRGMPARVIFGGENEAQSVSSSGSHIAKVFDTLLPSITERFEWCVENFRSQADGYLDDQIGKFQAMLREFLDLVPSGGTKDKAIKARISKIKRELRFLIKWNRLFYIYKNLSFYTEIEHIFALAQNPIAATWEYSNLDEQGEYKKTYDHQHRDGRVYAVRGSWAMENGLMKVGPAGYLDQISMPGQDIGCMCRLSWVCMVLDLPGDMITTKGNMKLDGAWSVIQAQGQPEKQQPAKPDAGQSEPKGGLLRWFGFRGRKRHE